MVKRRHDPVPEPHPLDWPDGHIKPISGVRPLIDNLEDEPETELELPYVPKHIFTVRCHTRDSASSYSAIYGETITILADRMKMSDGGVISFSNQGQTFRHMSSHFWCDITWKENPAHKPTA